MPFDPAVWPQGCPPSDAVKANGRVYRVVKDDPPHERSFRTHFERKAGTTCEHRALSVFSDEAGARFVGRLFPGLGRWIACADLTDQHGVLKPDAS